MTSPALPSANRVLIVEDELMIRMLLEDMLTDLGYGIAGVAGSVEEALAIVREGAFELAILDVNLNGETVFPVAEAIGTRGIPFVFSTGYGERGLPPSYREHPTLQKPFQLEDLKRTLSGLRSISAQN